VFYVFYDIWGNIEAKTLDWLPFAYTGKELDAESGLYYFGARYYCPEIGRFITEDPVKGTIELPQRLNPYPLCVNNPVMYVDPDGEFWDGSFWGKIFDWGGIFEIFNLFPDPKPPDDPKSEAEEEFFREVR
jgi:RHS repeat-associated protein